MKSLLIIFCLIIISFDSLHSQRRSRNAVNKKYLVLDYGYGFFKGETVFDRFGGSYKKPNLYNPFYLSLSRLSIIKTRTIRKGRRRTKIELKRPVMKAFSVSLYYGIGTNRLDLPNEADWKGFDDKRYGLYLQYKGGKQIFSLNEHSVLATINPTVLFEYYTTQSIFQWNQRTAFLGLGLSGELSCLIKHKKLDFIKVAIEAGVLGYNFFSGSDNNPFVLQNNRDIRSFESRLSPTMFIFKLGIPLRELKF